MKKMPNKNYVILMILLIITVFLVFMARNIYLSKNKVVSKFYEYSNKITRDEFDVYMVENTDAIIYIADKYDLTYEKFENEFKSIIDSQNLKDRVVYIDKSEINDSFVKHLKKEYKIEVDMQKLPVVIEVIDKTNIKTIYIDQTTSASEFINYEEFK